MRVLLISAQPFGTGDSAYAYGLMRAMLHGDGLDVGLIMTARPEHIDLHTRKLLKQAASCSVVAKSSGLPTKWRVLREFRKIVMSDTPMAVHIVQKGISSIDLLPHIPSTRGTVLVAKHLLFPATERLSAIIHRASQRVGHLMRPGVCTAFSTSLVAKSYGVRGTDSAMIIPPAVDTTFYRPVDLTDLKPPPEIREEPPDGRYEGLYIGPIVPGRLPYTELLRGTREFERESRGRLNLTLVGRGLPQERQHVRRIEDLACALGIRGKIRHILRPVGLEERLFLYNLADIIFFPLRPPFAVDPVDPPISLLEAMACGGVAVASKTLSIPEVIHDGFNGLLLDSMDERCLVEQISLALTDGGKMSAAARATIERRFSTWHLEDILRLVYDSVHESQ